jgi:hypothetical protein
VSWDVKEDFIAFNGWNNNQGDKITEHKYFQILYDYDDDGEYKMYLGEISVNSNSFQDFMKVEGEL